MSSSERPKNFRISAVQDNQVWLEGGLLDGLQAGIAGEIYYEITVLGRKKRIVPAKVQLVKVEDRQSIGALRDETGVVNIGYSATLTPAPLNDLLTLFLGRATELFSSRDYDLANQFYRRILEALPEDPFAMQRVQESDAALARQAELARERRNLPYYKQVARSYLEPRTVEAARIATTYIDKILAAVPGDQEALRLQEHVRMMEAATPAPIGTAAEARSENSIAAAASPAIGMAPRPEVALGAATSLVLKEMVYIPEAEVGIGMDIKSTPFFNETPRQRIHIAAYYIDRHEVTNEQYKKFCDATGRTPPSYFSNGDYPSGGGKRPVVMISWIDADAYARWAGKRLPREFEWELAAAGPDGGIWPWGNSWDSRAANTREGGEREPSDVGSHPGDVSGFGIHDMAGNVSEWTADWYQPYPGNTRREKEYGAQFKVLRGGSVNVSREFTRCQFRARLPDGFRAMDLGFRCALSASDPRLSSQATHLQK